MGGPPGIHPRMMIVRHHAPGHWIGLFLLLAVVVGMGILIWQNYRSQPRPQPAGGHDPAVAELRLRYARGEISREDFVARSDDLRGGNP